MTAQEQNPGAQPPNVDAALTALHENSDQSTFLHALAHGQIVLPQTQDSESAEGVALPYIEQEGKRYVLAFSSQQHLDEAGIDVAGSVAMSGAELASMWPQEEELWLALNPTSEQGASLPPDVVRSLTGALGS